MMQGILGIAWGNGVDTNYNNVIDNLKSQGITQSRAFGLNLASIDISGTQNLGFSMSTNLGRRHHLWWN